LRQRNLRNTRRLLRQNRAARRGRLPVHSLPQLFVPLSPLDTLNLALQLVIAFLFGPDLLEDLDSIGRVQLLDQLGHQVLVLQRFLDSGQRRRGGLPLPRIVAILCLAVAGLLDLKLPPKPF
jgi:hypothetical protein